MITDNFNGWILVGVNDEVRGVTNVVFILVTHLVKSIGKKPFDKVKLNYLIQIIAESLLTSILNFNQILTKLYQGANHYWKFNSIIFQPFSVVVRTFSVSCKKVPLFWMFRVFEFWTFPSKSLNFSHFHFCQYWFAPWTVFEWKNCSHYHHKTEGIATIHIFEQFDYPAHSAYFGITERYFSRTIDSL